MATSIKLKSDIKKIEAAIKSKATPKSLVPKLQAQLEKIKDELASLNSPKPKKGVTKTKVLSSLQKLKAKVKSTKSLAGYKNKIAGKRVDLKKDAEVPALPLGKRYAQTTGTPYYEYRLNRADVKQPPKRYPKLEDGGMMARGGATSKEWVVNFSSQEGGYRKTYYVMAKSKDEAIDKGFRNLTNDGEESDEYKVDSTYILKKEDGGMMAKGGVTNNYILSFNYNPSNLSNEDAERIVTKYTKNWKHDNDWDEVSFYVFNLTKEDADMLSKELKMENVYNIELDYSRYANGGMMASGGKISDKQMQRLDSGFEFIIYTDLPRQYGQYHISMAKEKGDVVYIVKSGHVADSKKVKTFTSEKDAFDYLTNKFGVKVSRKKMNYEDGGMMASGGRLKSAVNRDRAYKSDEAWEQSYKRKSRPKNPKYDTSDKGIFEKGGYMAEGGKLSEGDKILAELKQRLESGTMPTIICPKHTCGCGLCAPKSSTKENYEKVLFRHVDKKVFENNV